MYIVYNLLFIMHIIIKYLYTYSIYHTTFIILTLCIPLCVGILLAVTIIYQYYEMFEKVNTDPNAFVQ